MIMKILEISLLIFMVILVVGGIVHATLMFISAESRLDDNFEIPDLDDPFGKDWPELEKWLIDELKDGVEN